MFSVPPDVLKLYTFSKLETSDSVENTLCQKLRYSLGLRAKTKLITSIVDQALRITKQAIGISHVIAAILATFCIFFLFSIFYSCHTLNIYIFCFNLSFLTFEKQ